MDKEVVILTELEPGKKKGSSKGNENCLNENPSKKVDMCSPSFKN